MMTQTQAQTITGGALAGDKPRVIVSTDIGGNDPDDFQSMIHLLLYADVLEIEGLISSPPFDGRAGHIHETLDAYEKDYTALSKHGEYPLPASLRSKVKQGAVEPAPAEGFHQPTEGSRWIQACVQAGLYRGDERPVWVLVWGCMTDLAQVLHDSPEIKPRLRVYAIGSWNTRQDQAARDYIFRQHPDLWLIENDSTFRGMYVGGMQEGSWGNTKFLQEHVAGHGAMGEFFMKKKADIKMGDTPSVLYLLRGSPEDPTLPGWGGRFVKTDHGPNYWKDDPDPRWQEGRFPGAKTVNQWRKDYLEDWQQRMDRVLR